MGYTQMYTVPHIVKNARPQGLKDAAGKMFNPNQLVCKASGETIHRIPYGHFWGGGVVQRECDMIWST